MTASGWEDGPPCTLDSDAGTFIFILFEPHFYVGEFLCTLIASTARETNTTLVSNAHGHHPGSRADPVQFRLDFPVPEDLTGQSGDLVVKVETEEKDQLIACGKIAFVAKYWTGLFYANVCANEE